MDVHDLVGATGGAFIVGTYFLLQVKKVSSGDLSYSILNAIGAAMILSSLMVDFNLGAFLIEAFWLLISVIGVCLWFVRRRRGRS